MTYYSNISVLIKKSNLIRLYTLGTKKRGGASVASLSCQILVVPMMQENIGPSLRNLSPSLGQPILSPLIRSNNMYSGSQVS